MGLVSLVLCTCLATSSVAAEEPALDAAPVESVAIDELSGLDVELDLLRESRRWRRAKVMTYGGVPLGIGIGVGIVAGGLFWDPLLFGISGAVCVAAFAATPVGLWQQSSMLREVDVPTTRLWWWLALASGVSAVAFPPLGVGAPVFLVLQAYENKKGINTGQSLRRSSVTPWTDGENRGLSLALAW